MAVNLVGGLPVRVAKPELDVFETTTVDLDNPIGDRVAEGVWRDVVGLAEHLEGLVGF